MKGTLLTGVKYCEQKTERGNLSLKHLNLRY